MLLISGHCASWNIEPVFQFMLSNEALNRLALGKLSSLFLVYSVVKLKLDELMCGLVVRLDRKVINAYSLSFV